MQAMDMVIIFMKQFTVMLLYFLLFNISLPMRFIMKLNTGFDIMFTSSCISESVRSVIALPNRLL